MISVNYKIQTGWLYVLICNYMSALYANVRREASHQAVMESWKNTKESNDYDAVKKLNLSPGTLLENRGERIDEYQRRGRLSKSEMDAVGSQADEYRRWCGRFVYYCYSEAFKVQCPNGSLPFSAVDLWSGQSFRAWANQYKDNLTCRRNTVLKEKFRLLNNDKMMYPQYPKMVSLLDEMADEERVMAPFPGLVNEIKLLQDLFPFRIWDSVFPSLQDPKTVRVERGDIFIMPNNHIGMATGDSFEGHFETIEGNQSTVIVPRPYNNSVQQLSKDVSQCSLIIRI